MPKMGNNDGKGAKHDNTDEIMIGMMKSKE
jgi:hypothetical protein